MIVTTCLVVLSSRFYFWKNRLRRRNSRRTVMGTTDRRGCLVSKHLEILKNGYWNRLSEIRNGMAGRTVVGTTDRHRPFNGMESLNSVTEQWDGPLQARRPVLGCVIPDWVGFLLSNLRGVLDYSGFNYKVSGLMLISLITLGIKEVTLSKLVGYYCHILFLIIC